MYPIGVRRRHARREREANTWLGDQPKKVDGTLHSEQTPPGKIDEYQWDQWGVPPDRTLARDEFLNPDFLLPEYPQLSLREKYDEKWPRSLYRFEVYVRSQSTKVPVVFGMGRYELMNGILESRADTYRRKLAALIERAKTEGKPVEVSNIDRFELPDQARR